MSRRSPLLLVVGLLLLAAPSHAQIPESDEFSNPATLALWQRVDVLEDWGADQLQSVDIDVTRAGHFTLVPHASTWYQDWRGVLVFRPVTGDFVATASVHVERRTGAGAPTSQYSLAGILVRTPRAITPATWAPGGENYVFLSLGAADQPGSYQHEVKTTEDSVSTLQISPAPGADAEIQVARIGNAFIMLRRPLPAGAWTVHRRYPRSDMPATLQVGMTVYTDWPTASTLTPFDHNQTVIAGGNPDLVAQFDYFRFAAPVVPAPLAGLDLTDPGQVTDEQLLDFLGENANPAPTTTVSGWAAY